MSAENGMKTRGKLKQKIINRTQWHFFTVFFNFFHPYIGIFNLRYPCQYLTKFLASWCFLKRKRSSIEAMKNIFYVFDEDFRENCVENKAIFGTNYSIAK